MDDNHQYLYLFFIIYIKKIHSYIIYIYDVYYLLKTFFYNSIILLHKNQRAKLFKINYWPKQKKKYLRIIQTEPSKVHLSLHSLHSCSPMPVLLFLCHSLIFFNTLSHSLSLSLPLHTHSYSTFFSLCQKNKKKSNFSFSFLSAKTIISSKTLDLTPYPLLLFFFLLTIFSLYPLTPHITLSHSFSLSNQASNLAWIA